ncbi:hypothetical protein [Yoonia sediminilitoris]|uniref:DoxX-like protein n=1 Tax=Yoonia sediminilitoris TaxID=1286148 RepID=A0A2T6K571_9RHOB|nr:hypothetical protein [Yoonia sediminilitoris]PUB09780.1 hypothetical protein C8N45_1251 [Yoonia sediminilitoris]RCW89560.1 hypothetical protein DFP92_1251 [Yoonia sediminilitoris]
MPKFVFLSALIAVSLISIAAGAAKVMRTPQEVEFFMQAGLGIIPLIILGVIQSAGGVIAFLPKFRFAGLSLVTLGFFLSVVVIALTGNIAFAAISMLPVLLSGGLALRERNRA